MNEGDLEDAVAAFFDEAEHDLSMSPESFAARFGGSSDEVVAAVRSALEISDLLDDAVLDRPRTIGPYRIIREIGRGGMGVVYEVERDGDRFALKMLRAAFCEPRTHERFRREAEVLSKLDRPGIVRFVDRGVDASGAYLVMELVPGESAACAKGRISFLDAAALVANVARSLAAAHDVGLVHRDVKPHNIIVRPDGMPVLVDFGLTFDDDQSSLTGGGDRIGTPRYMAPEQFSGRATEPRTDVYGLGITLYELATGHPPFLGESREAVERLLRDGGLPQPRRSATAVPKPLDRIIRKATAFLIDDRYESAVALADDLDRFRAGLPIRGVPPAFWRSPGNRRVLVRSLLGAVILLATGVAIETIRRSRPAPTSAIKETRFDIEQATADLVCSWIDGDHDGVARIADRILEESADHPTASAIARSIDHRKATAPRTDEERSLESAIESYRSKNWSELADRVGEHGRLFGRSSLVTFLEASAEAGRGKITAARDGYIVLANTWPKCGTVAVELARAYAKTGELVESKREYLRAALLGRGGGALCLEVAKVHYKLREFAAAIAAAEKAAKDDTRVAVAAGVVVAQCKNGDGRPHEAKAALAEVLKIDPANVEAHHFFGFVCDQLHEIADAATHYRAAADADPLNVSSRLFLANLHAGADCGVCPSCDAAFAERKDLLAPKISRDLLLEVVRSSRLPSEESCRLFVTVALKLTDRSALITAIRDRIGPDPDSPAARRWRVPLESLVAREPK